MAKESAKDWGAMFSAGVSPNGMSAPPQAYQGVRAAASAQYRSTRSPSCAGAGGGAAVRGGGTGPDFAPHATRAVAVGPSKVRLEKRSMLRLEAGGWADNSLEEGKTHVGRDNRSTRRNRRGR